MTNQSQQHKCYQTALSLLTRREHSRLELIKKLQQKDYSNKDIEFAISLLVEQKYQSDERFTESFINMRFGQGKGPLLIAIELKDRGIHDFDLSIRDWFNLAREVRRKKYGSDIPSEYKEKAKQKRFLQSRGFSFDQINKAFLEY